MSEIKLKPCPFCGGEAKLFQMMIVKGYSVKCVNGKCGADFYFYGAEKDKSKMIRRFNRRANNE